MRRMIPPRIFGAAAIVLAAPPAMPVGRLSGIIPASLINGLTAEQADGLHDQAGSRRRHARSRDGRHSHADLSIDDVRAGLRRPVSVEGIFVLAQRQSDGARARAEDRGARERRRAARAIRRAWPRSRSCSRRRSRPAITRSSRTSRTAARIGIATKIYSRFGVQFTFVDTANPDAVRKAIRPQHEADLHRDAGEPDAEADGYRRDLQDREGARHSACRRQHVPDAVLPAAARARRQHLGAQHDEVLRRPQCDDGRRRHLRQRRARSEDAVSPERDGRDHVAVRGVADAAGHEDAVAAPRAAIRERAGNRRVPREAPEGRAKCATRAFRASRSTRSRKSRRAASARCSGSRSKAASKPARSSWTP